MTARDADEWFITPALANTKESCMFTRNPVLLTLAAVLCLGSASAHAATTQQNKMKQCNLEAQGKKGTERKALMKACLSKKATVGGVAAHSTKSTPQAAGQGKAKAAAGESRAAPGTKS
jgi:hypothetical protein